MSGSQTRAIQNYRARLSERGLARFEVLGRDADRELIRLLARRLAENSPESARIRAAVSDTINGKPAKKGGILAALRRSPLVGADIEFTRHHEEGREIELQWAIFSTNILSNVTKKEPSATLMTWIADRTDEDLFIASLTVAEIQRGSWRTCWQAADFSGELVCR